LGNANTRKKVKKNGRLKSEKGYTEPAREKKNKHNSLLKPRVKVSFSYLG